MGCQARMSAYQREKYVDEARVLIGVGMAAERISITLQLAGRAS